MKKSILFLAIFFGSLSLFAAEPVVKFYMNDGSSKQYNIGTIESFSFNKVNDNFLMKLYLKDSSVYIYPTSIVEKFNIFQGKNKLSVFVQGDTTDFDINNIDSIVFIKNQFKPAQAIVTIDKNEIGGDNNYIKSLYKEKSIFVNDTASTFVSPIGTQVLFCFDSINQLRGLTLSTIKKGQPDIQSIDANSTANTLIFLTIGILTTNPVETETVLQKINKLQNLSKFIENLKTNLPINTLSNILQDSTTKSLLDSCISEYMKSYKNIFLKKEQDQLLLDTKFMFEIYQDNINNILYTKFENYSWRFLNIYRRDLGQSQNELNLLQIQKNMRGAIPISWGSLFTLTTNKPTIAGDDFYNLTNNIKNSEYWIIGPGFNNSQKEIPPATLNAEYFDALGMTFIYNTLFPVIDILSGGASLIQAGSSQVRNACSITWNTIKQDISLSKVYNQNIDPIAFARETINIGSSMFSVGLTSGALVSAGFISGETATALSLYIAEATVIFGTFNFLIMTYNLFTYPESFKFDILNQDHFEITGINPYKAKIGDIVALSGSGFGLSRGSSLVNFNGIDAIDYINWSNTEIKVKVPTGATSGKVLVTVNGTKSNEVDFTVNTSETYESVKIGTQVWMKKNLDVCTYRDGTPIQQITDPTAWSRLTTGAWCYYNNSDSLGNIYGILYNGYAVNNSKGLAPAGWHIPSDSEWTTLTTYLGGESAAGGKLKEAGTSHWLSPNLGATNSSGFSALPGGFRNEFGSFGGIGVDGFWRSSVESNATNAWAWKLGCGVGNILGLGWGNVYGFSVRCIHD